MTGFAAYEPLLGMVFQSVSSAISHDLTPIPFQLPRFFSIPKTVSIMHAFRQRGMPRMDTRTNNTNININNAVESNTRAPHQ